GGQIVVVIIPDENGDFMLVFRSDDVDVGLFSNAGVENSLRGQRSGAGGFHAFIAKQPEHAESIQYRLIQAVGSQFAKTGKVRLIFKFKGPGNGAKKVDALLAN